MRFSASVAKITLIICLIGSASTYVLDAQQCRYGCLVIDCMKYIDTGQCSNFEVDRALDLHDSIADPTTESDEINGANRVRVMMAPTCEAACDVLDGVARAGSTTCAAPYSGWFTDVKSVCEDPLGS